MAEESGAKKIGEKIKSIFSKKSGTGSTSAKETGQSGPDAYRPMSSFKSSGHSASDGGGASNGLATNSGAGAVPTSGTSSQAQTAERNVTGQGGPEGVTSEESTALKSSFPHEPWENAREKTLAAEKEAEKAHISTDKAHQHLKAAGAAQSVVQSEAEKHAQALADADAVRPAVGTPTFLEKEVAATQELVGAKRLAAEDAATQLKEAEADLNEKAKLAEERKPRIDEHRKKVSTLTEDYEEHVRERKAKETNKGELLAIAADAEKALEGHGADIDALAAELAKADEIAAEREREFITAKDAAAALSKRLSDAKEKRRQLEEDHHTKQKEADEAEESVEGFREETKRLKRQLDEYEEEWVHMQNMEKDYQAEADEASANVEQMRKEYDPAAKELKDAQQALLAKQGELDKARKRAKDAEAKFKELSQKADQHAARSAQAATAAHNHAQQYKDLEQDAKLHDSKHEQLWQEAVGHGSEGSNLASEAVHNLEEKVKHLLKHDATKAPAPTS